MCNGHILGHFTLFDIDLRDGDAILLRENKILYKGIALGSPTNQEERAVNV